jgi:predicted dinucleotide-binding enzyme
MGSRKFARVHYVHYTTLHHIPMVHFITIVGAGHVGAALGEKLTAAGNVITWVTKTGNQSKHIKHALNKAPGSTQAPCMKDGLTSAEVVIMAVPGVEVPAVVAAGGQEMWVGKIVIDATNCNLQVGQPGVQPPSPCASWGQYLQSLLPQSFVHKGFNATGYENILNPLRYAGRAVNFIAGDDRSSKALVLCLSDAIGMDTVDLGGIGVGGHLCEEAASIWLAMANLPPGRHFALTRVM